MCQISSIGNKLDMDDLSELAELAKLANPLARNPKPSTASSDRDLIIRCPCKSREYSSERDLVQCSKCNVYSHINCVQIDNPTNWICPFCTNRSAEILDGAGINLAQFHHELADLGALEQAPGVICSADRIKNEIDRASSWFDIIARRDDIYDVVESLGMVSLSSEVAPIANSEMREEREIFMEISQILKQMADEQAELQTPLLDAIVDQIQTHDHNV